MDERTPIRDYIYPGHPLVVAYCVLKVFPSAKAALAPSFDKETSRPHGWSAMIGCGSIPGSGDAAYNGERVLAAIWTGRMIIEQAIVYADELWRSSVGPGSGNHELSYEPGLAEAQQYKAEFRTLAAAWDWSK